MHKTMWMQVAFPDSPWTQGRPIDAQLAEAQRLEDEAAVAEAERLAAAAGVRQDLLPRRTEPPKTGIVAGEGEPPPSTAQQLWRSAAQRLGAPPGGAEPRPGHALGGLQAGFVLKPCGGRAAQPLTDCCRSLCAAALRLLSRRLRLRLPGCDAELQPSRPPPQVPTVQTVALQLMSAARGPGGLDGQRSAGNLLDPSPGEFRASLTPAAVHVREALHSGAATLQPGLPPGALYGDGRPRAGAPKFSATGEQQDPPARTPARPASARSASARRRRGGGGREAGGTPYTPFSQGAEEGRPQSVSARGGRGYGEGSNPFSWQQSGGGADWAASGSGGAWGDAGGYETPAGRSAAQYSDPQPSGWGGALRPGGARASFQQQARSLAAAQRRGDSSPGRASLGLPAGGGGDFYLGGGGGDSGVVGDW